jgi:PAS domain S-box-containing protein
VVELSGRHPRGAGLPACPVRILLLEDSAIDAELLNGHLAKDKQDFTIDRVVSREAFHTALQKGGFDVILSDFSLPDFDGLAALELSQTLAPDVPFIFVSGLIGEEFATSSLRRGATDYILKRNLSRVSTSIDRALSDVHQRAERRKAEAALRELNATLEERVAERTRQLQESEARLRTIFQTSNQYQGFMTPQGVLLDTNELSLEGIGASLADVTGRNYWDTPWFALTPGMPETIKAAVERVAAGEAFHREVALNLPKLGSRWFELTIRPIYNKFGDIIALVPEAVDFTHRRSVEEALRQSQKMEALGQLTGGIAHDFNNLLTGITGALDLIRRRLAAGRSDGIERIMDAAFASSQRAAALTHRLLAFARRQSLDTKPEDANALIEGLEDILRRTLGENTALQIELAGDLWPALTDGNQLEAAILNLVINARDAMPGGGALKITTRNVVVSAGEAKLGQDIQPGEFVALSVIDSGIGIEPELLDKVFEPFFTTKPIGQGTGLGLSMIYGFAKQSGGFVRIESTLGKGTSVEILLPSARQMQRAMQDALPETAAGSGEMVLLVEDDNTVRLLVCEVLTELGYRFIETGDAASAIPVLQSTQPIDLLITDVGLPVMNGRQLADIARQHRSGLKVLFITGYAADAAMRSEFLEPGMDLMTKPFTFDGLSQKIRQLIEGE